MGTKGGVRTFQESGPRPTTLEMLSLPGHGCMGKGHQTHKLEMGGMMGKDR